MTKNGEAVPDLDHFYRELADINIALSSERNLGRLSHIVLLAAKRFCNADAAVFLDMGENNELVYGIVQVDSLKLRFSRRNEEGLGVPNIPLRRPKNSIMAMTPPVKAALEGLTVYAEDVHEAPDLDSSTCAAFDKHTGYRTKSLLAVSIRDSRDQILGVLQLANAKDPVTGKTVPFSKQGMRLVEILAAQAGGLMENLGLHQRVVSTGVSLTTEQDPSVLVERVVFEARRLANADGGTLYLCDGDNLKFVLLHSKSKNLLMGGSTETPIPFPPLKLYDPETGEPNYTTVATRAALDQQPIHVPDVATEKKFDCSGTRELDKQVDYETRSVYAVPLISRQGVTIGVLEVLNAQHPKTGEPSRFDRYTRSLIDALASQAGVAIDNQLVYQQLIETGISLSAEHDHDRLMEKILLEAKEICNAEGGTLYLRSHDDQLDFTIVHNDVLGIAMGGKTGKAITFPALNMYNPETGAPNHRNVATHVAITGDAVNIPDAYEEEGFDFSGTRAFDKTTGYRSKSFLTVPLKDRDREVIGVLQLINARDWQTGEVIRFSHITQPLIESLSSQAAVALNNQQLMEAQRKLLDSFIEVIAGAIDAKSPYTGGHCQRVPELARLLSEAAGQATAPPFDDFVFTEEDRYELNIASLLHDCGKVTTPEYVVDKATKLETIYNRIHEVRTRFEVLKRDAEIDYLKALNPGGEDPQALKAAFDARIAQLDDDFRFIAGCNIGGEFMDEADMERVRRIAGETWTRTIDDRLGLSHTELERYEGMAQKPLPTEEHLLANRPDHLIPRPYNAPDYNAGGFEMDVPENLYNLGEVYNLTIQRGTLTEEERFKINEHIIQTIVMLEQLPFPRHLKRVPEYAGGHHEKMDGTGYPRRLSKKDMSVIARIMAVADIFEALTASDRPYKKAKKLSEAVRIMSFMAKDAHIDIDLFRLFLESGAYIDYAKAFLMPEQIDEVDIAQYLGK